VLYKTRCWFSLLIFHSSWFCLMSKKVIPAACHLSSAMWRRVIWLVGRYENYRGS
jgi:hypothetical protein